MQPKDVREWLQFLFVAAGGALALVAFFQNLRQRRVENALKFLTLFRDSLRKEDMGYWKTLLRCTGEPVGARAGQYFNVGRKQLCSIDDYFSEGSEDGQAISRIAQSLDVICHQVVSGVADARTVFYEVGQLLQFFHTHLAAVPSAVPGKNLEEQAFPSIGIFFRRYEVASRGWPTRVHAYLE